MQLYLGNSNISFPRIFPYAATKIKSGAIFLILFIKAVLFLILSGWQISRLFSCEYFLTSPISILLSLPDGLSG